MLKPEQIDEIHRLHWHQKWSLRDIARHLNLNRRTVTRYLITPAPKTKQSARTSKLDAFHQAIDTLLEQAPNASAVVILQRLRPLGYQGGISILKQYLHSKRSASSTPRAFVRVESLPGDRFEIDWGHFGSLNYEGDARKLYAFSLVECHSRMMYVEFTHSQCFETFVRCHIHAFQALVGIARELVYDNLSTAVADHDGNLVRFNPRFLAFAREFGFIPRACHVASPWEKGKVERAGIGYLRQNFWPLRQFRDLVDVNAQARHWLDEVANVRTHSETREQPKKRFRPDCLRPLPSLRPDYRDTAEALVHKDIRLQFDSNRYCVPARYVGRRLTVKADSSSVVIYDQQREIATYARSWRRGQTFGADRFEKSCLRNVRQPNSPAPSNAWLPSSANALPYIFASWLARTGRCPVRSRNSTISSATTDQKPWRKQLTRPCAHMPSVPTTSPTSCVSSERPEMSSLPFVSKIPA